MKKKRLSVRIDEDLHSKLCHIAELDNRKASNLVLYLLLRNIEEFEKMYGKIVTD